MGGAFFPTFSLSYVQVQQTFALGPKQTPSPNICFSNFQFPAVKDPLTSQCNNQTQKIGEAKLGSTEPIPWDYSSTSGHR